MKSEGIVFLSEVYKDLYKSKEVMHRTNIKDISKKEENIKKYLDRLERIHNNAYTRKREDWLYRYYFNKYIINKENIPDSLNKNYIITIQKLSLLKWIDYLCYENNTHPMWVKYWAFQGMLSIGTYNEENKVYMKRSTKTLSPFIELNKHILSCIMTEVVNNQTSSYKFSKIYTELLEESMTNDIKSSKVEDGTWIKYYGFSNDYKKLSKDIEGKAIKWCTKNIETAEYQLNGEYGYSGGDFYIYYTKDNNGNYTIPRLAIRMEKKQIGEIRGISKSQNIEEGIEDILEEKLISINASNTNKFINNLNNFRTLTKIKNKTVNNEELTEEEILLLYGVKRNLETFSFRCDDPRIEEIIKSRIIKNDINIIVNSSVSYENKVNFFAYNKNIKYVKYLSDNNLIFDIVKKNVEALEYVNNQTESLCMSALNNRALAIKYIRNQTYEMCLIAIKYNACLLKYIKNQTPEICIMAVEKDESAIEYVKNLDMIKSIRNHYCMKLIK